MAKEFVMGARIKLKDSFTKPITGMKKATNKFSASIVRGDQGVQKLKNTVTRARDKLNRFTASTRKSSKGLKGMTREATKARKEFFSLNNILTTVAGGVAFKAGFDWLVGGNANMETYRNTLAVVLKDQEKAVRMLAWAEKFAAKTPFQIPQIVEATTRMSAYGLNAQKTLGIVGDMAAVMGKGLMQAVEAVADAQTGELERLKEFGITKKMIIEQAQLLGTNPVNNKGQITDIKAFNAALFSLMEKRFKGGMEMQSKTFKGMVSNVKDFMGTMGRQLGKPLFEAAKKRLQGFLGTLNRLRDSGAIDRFTDRVHSMGRFVSRVVGTIAGFINRKVKYVMYKLKRFYLQNEDRIKRIRDGFITAFTALAEYSKPVINWLSTTGLPLLVDGFTIVTGWVIKAADFFVTHWEPIKPFILGIAIALGVYKGAILAVNTATKLWAAATWAVNVAMAANPVGLVITGIGLLIGAGILLVKNWDRVEQAASNMWTGISNGFKKGVNFIIKILNKLIDGLNNAFQIKLPDWLGGKEFKLNIPKIGLMVNSQAMPGSNRQAGRMDIDGSHKNGLKRVPFDGYRAEMHKGESILNKRDTDDLYKGINPVAPSNTNTTTKQIIIEKLVEKIEINGATGDTDNMVEEFMTKLYDRIKAADDILGADRGALLYD